MIIELMGPFPRRLALSGRYSSRFFHRSGSFLFPFQAVFAVIYRSPGELKHIARLRMWPLGDVLREKYGMPPAEAQDMAQFLEPMLRLDPRKRASAAEMLTSPWLNESTANVPPATETRT